MTLNDAATLIGLIAATIGLVLGTLNHFRDKAKIVVDLQWDMKTFGETVYDPEKQWGAVRVSNVGRRPIYVSHAAICVPKGYEDSHLLLMEGVKGEKVTEGDPPLTFIINQEGLETYAKDWKKLRAQVSDSTGRIWRSKKVRKRPSWANPIET